MIQSNSLCDKNGEVMSTNGLDPLYKIYATLNKCARLDDFELKIDGSTGHMNGSLTVNGRMVETFDCDDLYSVLDDLTAKIHELNIVLL